MFCKLPGVLASKYEAEAATCEVCRWSSALSQTMEAPVKDFKMPNIPGLGGMFGGEQDPKNPKIVGAGNISGGKYDSVTITGSGKVEGSVEAASISASGSASFAGDVKAGDLSASGSVGISGSVQADAVSWSGSGSVGGGLRAKKFVSRGAFGIAQTLDADEIDIEINGESNAETIRGKNISVKRGHGASGGHANASARGGHASTNVSVGEVHTSGNASAASYTFVSKGTAGKATGGYASSGSSGELSDSRLKVDSIRGDTIELENTDAVTVTGRDVTIGEGCVIDTVTYSGKLTVTGSGTVKNKIKA
jgi:cytoskeletal protein CcmA (bactofilin family)